MKLTLKILGALLAVFLLVVAVEIIASESGEVVVVTTTDATGETFETRLWVVDHDGAAWIRSGSEMSGWYSRLTNNPALAISRGSNAYYAIAVPQVEQRALINGLMNEKYGWADDYIGLLFGREDAIPIRLQR